jgi:hypothetical protein
MSKMYSSQSGIGHVVLVVVIVAVFAATGAIGYHLYANKDAVSSDDQAQASDTTDVQAAPAITSTDDLDKATTVLDQVDPDSSDQSDITALTAQLDSF